MRTTVDGTLVSPQSGHMFGPPGTDAVALMVGRPPIAENGLHVGYVSPNEALDGPAGSSVITPDGSVLTVPADTVAFGVQVYNHPDVARAPSWLDAPDCFVTGTALLLKATLP
jgi:hypothetical protein